MQTEKNTRIEKEYDEMVKAQGTKKNQTPEHKAANTLKTAQRAITKALESITGDASQKALVNVDKLAKVDVTKFANIKETETDTTSLANSTYKGSRVDIYQWQHKQLASKSKKGSGGSGPYNIGSGTALATAKKIMDWIANNANSTKAKIADEVARLIPERQYKDYIKIKDGSTPADNEKQIKTKVKTIVAVLARSEDGIKGLEKLGCKLNCRDNKYIKCVVAAPVDLEFGKDPE